MRTWLAAPLLLGVWVVSAALLNAGAARGAGPFDGQYTGELTLKGIIGGDCTRPPLGAVYPLTIANGQVRFKYVPRFDTTLIGTIDATGNFKASRVLRRGEVKMVGRVQGTELSATITSPSCIYGFQGKY
jgi:hypothetical protein